MLLKTDLDVQQTHLWDQFVEQKLLLKVLPKSWLSQIWLWSHFVVLLKSDIEVQQTHLWSRFVEQGRA